VKIIVDAQAGICEARFTDGGDGPFHFTAI
jgi:hypothetical protein